MKVKILGEYLKELRMKQELPLRKVAAAIDIDTSQVAKFEKGIKLPTKENIIAMAAFFKVDQQELLTALLTEKTFKSLQGEEFALEAIERVEERLKEKINNNAGTENNRIKKKDINNR